MSGAAPDHVHAVRILLMDNQRLFTGALRASLEQDSRFEIVAVAQDGDEAVRLVDEAEPDVVLLDAGMPRDEALAATRSISSGDHPPRVMILTGADDHLDAVEAHDAGAAAFLRRPRSAADLLETLELATALAGVTVAQEEREEP
jgi:two-component system, NarL family, response regulator DegU